MKLDEEALEICARDLNSYISLPAEINAGIFGSFLRQYCNNAGVVMMPRVPTQEMIEAGGTKITDHHTPRTKTLQIYYAMVQACTGEETSEDR